MACLRCKKKFDRLLYDTSYVIPYNKCWGKTCPDCGKVRKLRWLQSIETDDPRFFNPCVKCKEKTNLWIDKICSKCFLERERKRGCTCFFDKDYDKSKGYHDNINYYCPLCEDVHPRESLCEECFEKQTRHNELKRTFLRVILPSSVVGMIVGFFLGWLIFRRLHKKKNNEGKPI